MKCFVVIHYDFSPEYIEPIIASRMGRRAQQLFDRNNIKVLCGASEAETQELLKQYLLSELMVGENICDH